MGSDQDPAGTAGRASRGRPGCDAAARRLRFVSRGLTGAAAAVRGRNVPPFVHPGCCGGDSGSVRITPTVADLELVGGHSRVAHFPADTFGYFGWPTLAKMEDGSLVAVASGMRNEHNCPFGRNVICTSTDGYGETWSTPRVVNDSPLDDRDSGVTCLGDSALLISWFSSDSRDGSRRAATNLGRAGAYEGYRDPATVELWEAGMLGQTDAAVARFEGSWVMASPDLGATFLPPVKVPCSAPHGPIKLRCGDLLYLGTSTEVHNVESKTLPAGDTGVVAARSTNPGGFGFGQNWDVVGRVPGPIALGEPHVLELQDGKLLGLMRCGGSDKYARFSMMQTVSLDGGTSWAEAQPLEFHGSPPHLLEHSSGVIICSYCNRGGLDDKGGLDYGGPGKGQRVMLSWNAGESWVYDWVLRADGTCLDLGYPSTAELGDGSLLTMYYQKESDIDQKCSLLSTRWRLPPRP
eukprot:SAG22_NODE_83_length_21704_cov_58.556584_3_plen_464_part_00